MSRDVITKPGLVGDMDEDWYHSDPVPESLGRSLSVTSSKLLLPPSPPAKFAWAREHGRLPSKAMRLGTLTHAFTLGTPAGDLAILDFKDRTRTKAFIAAEKEALDAGQQVVLRKEWDEARAMADALLTHPVTGPLLDGGDAEQSMFWQDPEFGIWLRMRADLTTYFHMPVVVDLKSTKDASPEAFAKSVAEYGYHRQDPHYREGWASVLGCDQSEIDFIFALVESEPPYLVAAYRLSDGTDGPDDVNLGREQNRIAREIYASCTESGRWPGYSQEIENLPLRHYDRQRIERQINDWHR